MNEDAPMPEPQAHTKGSLAQLQSLPLSAKIHMTEERIKAWSRHFAGMVYLAYSGGKDSTVLLDIIRNRVGLSAESCPAVFFDTGLEFPEIRGFCKEMGAVFVKPDKTFKRVVEEYGYPVVSKRVARYVYEARNYRPESATVRLRKTGIRGDGTYSKLAKIPAKWMPLIDAPFDVSDRCCHWLKKRPAHQYEKASGRKPMLGVRVDEGHRRELSWQQNGCNAFHLKNVRSWPMAFWVDDDVDAYIEQENLKLAKVYDMGYRRTGCVFCAFGCHMENRGGKENRFQLLFRTHPKLWRYCMNKLGMREVLDYIGVPTTPDNPFPT